MTQVLPQKQRLRPTAGTQTVRRHLGLTRRLACLALVLSGAMPLALPAAATGTLFCTIDDQNLKFELLGNTRTEDGTIIDVHQGSLTLKPGRAAAKVATYGVAKDNIFMQWTLDRDLRFAIR